MVNITSYCQMWDCCQNIICVHVVMFCPTGFCLVLLQAEYDEERSREILKLMAEGK